MAKSSAKKAAGKKAAKKSAKPRAKATRKKGATSKRSSPVQKKSSRKKASAARGKKSVTKTKKAAPGQKSASKKSTRKWSHHVNETSDSLDLEKGIFESSDPKKIADSLKRSAEKSKRKKAGPFQSAMSMLNFYINRAGKNLPKKQQSVLEKAKDELRKDFGREDKNEK